MKLYLNEAVHLRFSFSIPAEMLELAQPVFELRSWNVSEY
jgi:hypothetical protein